VHFEDLNSVVGQEVGNNEGPVIEITVVAEDFAVMVEELFLGKNFASSEFLLHVLEHLGIFLGGDRNFRHLKVVNGAILCWWLGRAEFVIKLAGVLVHVVYSELSAKDGDIASDSEILGHERHTVWLLEALLLEESSLRNTGIDLLGLDYHDGLVDQVVEDMNFADAVVLKAGLNNAFFCISEEFQDLLVEHNIGGLELLVDVLTEVVGELDVRDRLGRLGFGLSEICSWGARDSVQRNWLILVVADLLKVHMRDLLRIELVVEWIVGGHVTG